MLTLIIVGSVIAYLSGIGITLGILQKVFDWQYDDTAFICSVVWPITATIGLSYIFSQHINNKLIEAKKKRILLQNKMRVEIEQTEKEVEEFLQQTDNPRTYQRQTR